MRRSRKIILIALLAIVVLAGSIGGVVYAQTTESGDNSQTNTLLDRVAGILVDKGITITSEQLKDAFAQVKSEMQDEALDNQLQKLVDDGKINQDQADQYKAWLKSKPDVPLPFGPGGRGGIKPFGGFGRMPMHDWCEPQPTE